MRAVRLQVSGRVQGVGFRAYVSRLAKGFALGGWVRNLADGSVEVEASGEENALRAFVVAVREGPGAARVEHAAEQWFDAREAHPDFRVVG